MFSRRTVIEGGLAAGAFGGLSPTLSAAQSSDGGRGAPATTMLWHAKPAQAWVEGYPIGNGRIAAMLLGGVKRERVQLNEGTLFSGGPYHNVNPAARDALPEVRRLIFAGRYAEAETLANERVQAVPRREMSYQSLGDLTLDLSQANDTSFADYRRELDLDSAVATVRFVSDGIRYERQAFASAVDDVVAIRITADRPFALDCSLSSGQRGSVRLDDDGLWIEGVSNTDFDNPGRLRFAGGVAVVTDGIRTSDAGGIRVRDARSVLVLIAAATAFRSPVDVNGDPAASVRARLSAARAKGWDALHAAHVADHRALFRRLSIDLGTTEAAQRPTDNRLSRAMTRDDPALAALMVQFGRYMLIASSRGGEPANLQGKWNELNRPPWGSKYTININTEMNYWPAESGNLAECVEPLTRMVEELAISGARTAREMYGARGWVAHHNTDLWRASGPVDGARTGLWPMGAAWLSCQLWDHWDYGRDPTYLRRIYPLLRGAALFFLDTLVADPVSGTMVTNPSLSPENDHGHGSTLCAGPAMDRQLLRDLFDRTITSAETLRTDAALRRELAAMRGRLAPDRIGKAGQLQEWLLDWDADAPQQTHRHTSHLYALFPSQQVNTDDTPDLAAAVRRSLELRGADATGWALAWRIALWAHLRDADRAYAQVRTLLQSQPNATAMPGYQPPFQVDCIFGGAAGILEMLVQSRDERIQLLPALPAAWAKGSIAGVRVRGGCSVDLAWEGGRPTSVMLHPTLSGRRVVRHAGRTHSVTLTAGRSLRLDPAIWTRS
ncbi:glycoside hydrolase N-terminal domain-containing protein [Sphingomonas floccifaciens]|uniref:Glycoside hydrolase N-terminal domain-containing protein n=1 Tax=Sphingomonas floccifaciens TaxID=1844115 RepID=A0ABW4NE12_9SPHN